MRGKSVKTILAEIILIAGVLCFIAGAVDLFWGSLQPTETHSIAAVGLILIASGAGAKKFWKKSSG